MTTFVMKLSTLCLSLFVLAAVATARADDLEENANYWLDWNCSIGINSDYSIGYRVGTLNGGTEANTSYEAYLKLGTTTTVIKSTNVLTGQETQISPWKFSLSGSEKNRFLTSKNIRTGDKAYIGYLQYTFKSLSSNVLSQTDYDIIASGREDSGETDAYFADHTSAEAAEPFNIIGDKKEAYGFVLKASHRGYCLKTYELTLQIGENSDELHEMSIQDFELYKFALHALKSGRKVRFYYKQVDMWGRMLTTSETNLIIYKMELI